MKEFKSEITGHLEIRVIEKEDEFEGERTNWKEVLIHGDPKGLKSFANLLLKIADLNQEESGNLPIGAREHHHLRPNIELSKKSDETIVGRLDAKGTGAFPSYYISKDNLP